MPTTSLAKSKPVPSASAPRTAEQERDDSALQFAAAMTEMERLRALEREVREVLAGVLERKSAVEMDAAALFDRLSETAARCSAEPIGQVLLFPVRA